MRACLHLCIEQMGSLQALLHTLEQQLGETRESASAYGFAATKAESDLRDLSAAYNTLEVGTFLPMSSGVHQSCRGWASARPLLSAFCSTPKRVSCILKVFQRQHS